VRVGLIQRPPLLSLGLQSAEDVMRTNSEDEGIVLRKRHSPQEVASKLHQAEELLQLGKRQPEIARTLGISVMTYHRWRAAARAAVQAPSIAPEVSHLVNRSEVHRSSQDDLRAENAALRRLVVDLLLEKMRLEQELERRR
jgi:putative transposase